MSEYSKRDPANVPQEVNSIVYKKLFAQGAPDGKTTLPENALANVAWGLYGPELLEAVKLAYRKHHLGDDTIGWDELSDKLHNAICNAMGDRAYIEWMDSLGQFDI